jgi:aryl-alcohol dehydrogenase-like predicted oxidoreductase
MGGTRNRETSIFLYAYDKGVNYFDTAEGYINGQSEKLLSDALKFMDRKKVFITTKLPIGYEETKTEILDRFAKCQERLQTEYVDALFMHSVKEAALLNHSGFHEAVKELRSLGKLRYCGVSSHGPRNDDQDSMEKVLTAAAEDGRFDALLLIYNFMNDQAGQNILKACKKNDLGTTAMKTSPGILKADPVDPENLTGGNSSN